MSTDISSPDIPSTVEAATERLRRVEIPPAVVDVARRLQAEGYAAVVVGGSVRDALLGRDSADWDLASSAMPEEVLKSFKKTIPTGLEHGTVTVLVGRGDQREAVEVTTFRGEGAYVDGRRPSEVHFLRDLEEDLARRDFTINAFAWDPVAARFTDAFGGLEDLAERKIRAVGAAFERFSEDGLRVMRAVRFAATLEFSLDPATEAAIEPTLEVFDKVSRERVQVELYKLLGARRPSIGLRLMAATGLWARVLVPGSPEVDAELFEAVDALPADVELRLARCLFEARAREGEVDAVLEGLKPSRATQRRVQALLSPAAEDYVAATDGPRARRAAAALVGQKERALLGDAARLRGLSAARCAELESWTKDAPLGVKELALTGKELISEGICKPGPGLGRLLAALLEAVLEDPALNEPARLRALAPTLLAES